MKVWMRAAIAGLAAMLALSTGARAAEGQGFRIGVVGLVHGHVGGFFDAVGKRNDVMVVGVAESDHKIFEIYATKYFLDEKLYHATVGEMLKKTHPQAVVVFTSTADHTAVVEECAKAGIPVMMEKPLAVSVADALAMQAAAKTGKIPVLVNYETSWYPSNHAAYDLAHSGAIGDIRKVVIHDGHEGPKEIGVQKEFLDWLTDPKKNGGGALFDFGCYGADLMTWLMHGKAPLTVTAVTQTMKPDVYPKVDDEATIVLTYPKAQAIVQASWNWPTGRKDMEVYGVTGSVVTLGRDEVKVQKKGEAAKTESGKPLSAPYQDSLTYFRAVVEQGAKIEPLSSLETNVIVTRILAAARESAKSGKTVRLVE